MSSYEEGYLCGCCGKYHNELPMSYVSPVPDYCYDLPSEEQESRIEMNEDLCIIDDEYFFIRGCIEIPVNDGEEPFIWDVWVSLSEGNFDKTIDFWMKKEEKKNLNPCLGGFPLPYLVTQKQ